MDEDIGLKIPIIGDSSKFEDAMSKVKGSISTTMSGLKDAIGAAGLLAFGYLKGAVESAAKAEESTARLKTIVENQGESWETAGKKVSQFNSGILKMSTYSGGQGKEALTVLTQKGVELNKALDMQTTLVDLAAGKNIELSEAANILADAYNGKTKALISLGLATKDEIKDGISFEEVQRRINERFGGSASAQLGTYSGQMKQFNNNMNSLKSTIGSYILPYLTKLAEHLNKMAQTLNGLDPSTKKMIASTLGIVAILGTAIGGVGLFQKVLGILGPAVTGITSLIGGLTWPIGLIIAGVGLLVTAWVKDWGGIREKTKQVIDYIKPLIMNAFNAIVTWFKEHWPQIKATFDKVLDGLKSAYENILKPVLDFMIEIFKKIVQWVVDNWPLIQETVGVVIGAIHDVIVDIMNAIMAFWKEHGETIMAVTSKIWDAIKTAIDVVINTVLDIIKFVMELITGDWEGAWNTIVDAVSSIFNGVIKVVGDILSAIGDLFGDIIKSAWDWGKNLINGFIDGVKSKYEDVKNAAKHIMGAISDFLGFNSPSKEGEGRFIVIWGANMIKGFQDGIKKEMPNLKSLMDTVISPPDLKLNTVGSYTNIPNNLNKPGSNSITGNNNLTVEIPVNLDGKEVARISAPHLGEELKFQNNRYLVGGGGRR